MTMQWYKITRSNGFVQYATKHGEGFLLYGSGFPLKIQNAEITPVNEIPVELQQGYVTLDVFPDEYFKALRNKNIRWNGWTLPYIHISERDKILTLMSYDMFESESELFWVDSEGDKIHIPIELINGEPYYDFTELNWIFDWVFEIPQNDE